MHHRILWEYLPPCDQVAWMGTQREMRERHAARWTEWCQHQAWLDAESRKALDSAGALEAGVVHLCSLLRTSWQLRHARPDRIIQRHLRLLLRWRHTCSHCDRPLHPESERCDECRAVQCPACQHMVPLQSLCRNCGYTRLHPCQTCALPIPRDRQQCDQCRTKKISY